MTISLHPFGSQAVSFEGITPLGNVVDLGVAFINLPSILIPAVCMSASKCAQKDANAENTVRLRMEYYSGSWQKC